MRSFRVGGVRGVPTLAEEIVTIKTAVQLAVQYQTKGLEAQAEEIYRRILDEHPQYPDALHLMGVVYYHRGDALTAVQYVERALQSTGNFSFDGFHNTLGECMSFRSFAAIVLFVFLHRDRRLLSHTGPR